MSTPPADANTTDAGIGQWIRSHVRLVVGVGIIAVVGLVFVLVWFQPQKLFLDDTVDEAFPVAQTTTAASTTLAPTSTSPAATADGATTAAPSTTLAPTTTTTSTTTTTAGPVLLTDGSFIDIGHPGSGIAQVYVLPDGSRVLRFEELDVSNGPDLRVILSASPLVEDRNAYDEEFFDIEELKGNLGNQNYDIPAEVDLADYSTVAIWCRRFNYTFNAAPLTPVAEPDPRAAAPAGPSGATRRSTLFGGLILCGLMLCDARCTSPARRRILHVPSSLLHVTDFRSESRQRRGTGRNLHYAPAHDDAGASAGAAR